MMKSFTKLGVLISIVLSFFLAGSLYVWAFQTNFISRRELLFLLIAWIILVLPIHYWIYRFFLPIFSEFNHTSKWLFIVGSVFLGFAILINLPQPRFITILLPVHKLDINFPQISPTDNYTLHWFSSDLGDISLSQFKTNGNWEIDSNGLSFVSGNSPSLHWEGRVGENASLLFTDLNQSKVVTIIWDGESTNVNLVSSNNFQNKTDKSFGSTTFNRILTVFFCFLGLEFFVLSLILLTTIITLHQKKPFTQPRKFHWVTFAIPMVIVWLLYLFAFWPAMMFDDANNWKSLSSNVHRDLVPFFYTALIWLITRVWFSPSMVIIVQILLLSAISAWGIDTLFKNGLPLWGCWLLVGIIALSPINGNMVVFLQKDSIYSIFLFLFSLMVLSIIFSEGRWLLKTKNWIGLGIISLFVASIRHNGFPIPLLTLIILIIFYQKWWKPLLLSLLICFGLYWLIHGPVYQYLKVDSQYGYKQLVWEYKIAAHIDGGAPLNEYEQALLDKAFPGKKFDYNCCTILTTTRAVGYGKDPQAVQKLVVDLTLKEPLIEYQHLVCSSSMIWEVNNRCKTTTMEPSSTTRWIPDSKSDFHEESKLPVLASFLASVLIKINQDPKFFFFISPAFYFYFGFFCTLIFTLKRQNVKNLLYMLPASIQTGIMLFINTAPEFRYQYPVYLIGLFSIGLLLMSFMDPFHFRKE
jgi:hypothetical protein